MVLQSYHAPNLPSWRCLSPARCWEEAEGVEEKAEGLIKLEDLVEAEEVEHEAVDGEHCCLYGV